jgi:hypothetical protein
MTEKITVFHAPIPGSGDCTIFEGTNVEYRMEPGGALTIMRWITETEMGDAVFAAGQWSCVRRSAGYVVSPKVETTPEQIEDRVARFISRKREESLMLRGANFD